MSKKIMILGGSDFQLPLLRTAHSLGYTVVLCDMRPSCPGMQEADIKYIADYSDKTAVLEIAKKEKIDGIISNNEPAMLTVAYVSQALGLVGNPVESVEKLISKSAFRQLQVSAGVFSPRSFTAASPEALLQRVEELRFPIIIKPNEASGTRGTRRIAAYDEQEISKAFSDCRACSRNGLVTAEEYVEMDSLKVNDADVFVLGEEFFWDGMFQQMRAKETPMLPMTQIYPAQLSQEQRRSIRTAVETLMKAAGVQHGEYNVETYFTKQNEVFVIEINPRQGGNYIPQMIQKCCGVDLTKLLVSTAVGDYRYYESLKTFQRTGNYIALHPVFSKKAGVYEGLFIADEVKPFVLSVSEKLRAGEPAEAGSNAGQVIAHVLLQFSDSETQHRYAEHIEDYIYPLVGESSYA